MSSVRRGKLGILLILFSGKITSKGLNMVSKFGNAMMKVAVFWCFFAPIRGDSILLLKAALPLSQDATPGQFVQRLSFRFATVLITRRGKSILALKRLMQTKGAGSDVL